jgi:hypothetical protein
LHANEAVGNRAQSGKLVRVRPDPVAVIQIHDGAVDDDPGELLEELALFRGVARGSRLVEDLVNLGLQYPA